MWLHCSWPLVVFCVFIAPAILDIEWNPAVVIGLISLAASLVTELGLSRRTAQIRGYCRDWSELAHDSDRLWSEGKHLGWGKQQIIRQLEHLDARVRLCNANELEDPDKNVLRDCERELDNELDLQRTRQGIHNG